MHKKSISFIVILILFLSGCEGLPKKIPLDSIQAILVVGLDVYEDMVELTVVGVGSQPGSEGDKGKDAVKIYEASGRSVFEAKQNLSLYNDKHLIWAHLEYIIIGEETARRGIADHMDFFIRNHENRLTDELVIAKDMSAREFINSVDSVEPKMNEKLRHLFNDVEVQSVSKNMTIKDWLIRYQSDTMMMVLPVMETIDKSKKEESSKEGEPPKKDVHSAGYAIFDKDTKLIDYATLRCSRGINWLSDKIKSAVVVIDIDGKEILSAEILKSKTKLDITEDAKTLDVDIQLTFNIPEYTGHEDLYDVEHVARIKRKIEEIIELEVMDTMTYLQFLDADVVEIGKVYYHKYPENWPIVKSTWQNLFKEMKINVKVNSNVRNTYNIINPMKKG